LTRLLVARNHLADAEAIAVSTAQGYTVGDPMDPATRLGSLVSKTQPERVRGRVRAAEIDGAPARAC
jgi:aldehyde dehydrogenase (NAD+)